MNARRMRERHGATWGLGETGATAQPATATATQRVTPASRSPDPSNARLLWKRAAPTGGQTWTRFAKRALELLYEVISGKT